MKRILVCCSIILLLGLIISSKVSAQQQDTEKADLLKKIEELENKMNQLEEANKARKKLEVTAEEQEEREKEVLEAVGTEYTLDPIHTLGIDYSFSYSYSPAQTITNKLDIRAESDHTITHSIATSYSVRDNLSISLGLPFVYRYNKMGTDEELDQTDIGDMSLGLGYQPYRAKTGEVRTTIGLSVGLPTGRSPYKINPEQELSTGSGTYGFSVSGSFSKQIDPVVAFWNVGYSHSFPLDGLGHTIGENVVLDSVDFGDSFSFGAGLAYSMSYQISVNASFGYTYSRGSRYGYEQTAATYKTPDETSGSLGLGVGYRISDKTTLSFGLGYGLVGSGFSISVRVPFSFVL